MSALCRLYLITPPQVADLAGFIADLEAALSGGDVAALQIRLKDAPEDEVRRVVDGLKPLTERSGTALILNDRPDLAARFGCDGVHVGQDDASCSEARRFLGRDGIVGVTCHDSRHLAMEACEAGADYVAFGAFFETATKAASTRADPEILGIWQETMTTPCVAIGGITVERAAGLARAGADFVAVSSGVWAYEAGPQAAVRDFNRELAAGVKARPQTP